MTSANLFDRLAPRYDELWTATPVGRAQRDQTWRRIDPLFRKGERILDIGCGTGEDALHFTARGVTVYATDASPAMVEVARSRGVTATIRSARELAAIGGVFDGAISNFGALNCIEDLPEVAESLAAVVRPGGRLAICLIGRFCAWEVLYYALHLNFRKAVRRWKGHASASSVTDVYYPTVGQFRAAFAPHFELQRWTGIGLLVPPSYIKPPASIVRALNAADHFVTSLALLRAMADHRLFLLVRKPGSKSC